MKKFTVKDFITYNNPCFSCGKKINFSFYAQSVHAKPSNTIVGIDFTEVNLRISYSYSLNVKIQNKTNKFVANSPEALKKYLSENYLFLVSTCKTCMTTFTSKKLEFNLDKNIIKAVGILYEDIYIVDKNKSYHIQTLFNENNENPTSEINIYDPKTTKIALTLPALPLYKFKTKEHLIKKLKTYVLFS